MKPNIGDYIYVPSVRWQFKRKITRILIDGTIVAEYGSHQSIIRPTESWRPASKNGPQVIKSLVGFEEINHETPNR